MKTFDASRITCINAIQAENLISELRHGNATEDTIALIEISLALRGIMGELALLRLLKELDAGELTHKEFADATKKLIPC